MMRLAARVGSGRASKTIIRCSYRIKVDRLPKGRQYSTKKSSTHFSHEQVGTLNKKISPTSSESSSSSAVAAKDALVSKLTDFTTQATQLAKSKANDAVTNATDSIRASLHNTTVNAKIKSEQYAWEAHRSINKVTNEVETKIKNKAMDATDKMKHKAMETKDTMKQSVQDATLSTKEWIKDEFSKRMDQFKIPKTFFGGSSSGNSASTSSSSGGATQRLLKSESTPSQKVVESTTLKQEVIPATNRNNEVPSSQSKLSMLSSLLPNKERIFSSATSSIITKTVSDTTSNLSTQLQNTVHKTFKWLWWWGLAAVGVYGVSTTLTKEGVKALKDLVGNASVKSDDKESSSSLISSGVSNERSEAIEDANAAVVVESDYVNGGFEVMTVEERSKTDTDKGANGGWFSSWRRS